MNKLILSIHCQISLLLYIYNTCTLYLQKKKKNRMQSHTKILNIVYRDTDDLPKANC